MSGHVKSARFLLFTLYLPSLQSSESSHSSALEPLPTEECIGQAQVHLLPAREFLQFPFLSDETFYHYLQQYADDVSQHSQHLEALAQQKSFLAQQAHSKALKAANTFSLALWSAQQTIAQQLCSQATLRCATLPPMSSKAMYGYFTPSGRYWLGLVFYGRPSILTQKVSFNLQQLFKQPLPSTRMQPMPWLPEMGTSGSWALGASAAMGAQTELFGLHKK